MPPTFLYHIVTTDCNLTCKYCFYQCGLIPKIEQKDFDPQRLYSSAADCGVTSVSITGGEPLLHRKLLSILEAIKGNGLYCAILTNGTLINDSILLKLRSIGLDEIVISIDSHLPAINNSVRGAYTKIIRGFMAARACPEISLTASIVWSEHNLQQIPDLLSFLARLGVQRAALSLPATPSGRVPFNVSEKKFDIFFDQILNTRSVASVDTDQYRTIKDFIFNSRPPSSECAMGNRTFVIDADGTLVPCFQRSDLAIGNCYEKDLELLLRSWLEHKERCSLRMTCYRYNCLCLFGSIMISLHQG